MKEKTVKLNLYLTMKYDEGRNPQDAAYNLLQPFVEQLTEPEFECCGCQVKNAEVCVDTSFNC